MPALADLLAATEGLFDGRDEGGHIAAPGSCQGDEVLGTVGVEVVLDLLKDLLEEDGKHSGVFEGGVEVGGDDGLVGHTAGDGLGGEDDAGAASRTETQPPGPFEVSLSRGPRTTFSLLPLSHWWLKASPERREPSSVKRNIPSRLSSS